MIACIAIMFFMSPKYIELRIMMAFIKCLLLAVIAQITTTHASEVTLVHYDLKDGLAPYFWKNNNGDHIGIIPDIVARMKPYKLRFTEIPRKRLDDALLSGQIDFALMHPDYTEIDDKLNFIPTCFSQTKVLYQRLTDTTTPKHLSEVQNTTICARLGYKNPVIELVSEEQNIRIVQSPDNETMMRMLNKIIVIT